MRSDSEDKTAETADRTAYSENSYLSTNAFHSTLFPFASPGYSNAAIVGSFEKSTKIERVYFVRKAMGDQTDQYIFVWLNYSFLLCAVYRAEIIALHIWWSFATFRMSCVFFFNHVKVAASKWRFSLVFLLVFLVS